MNLFWFALILTLLSSIYLIVAYIVSRSITSVTDYFLAGRNLNLFQLAVSLVATQLGGGLILGISQYAYSIGYLGLLYVIGISIGFVLLSCGIATRLRSFDVMTTAQLFETHYGSTTLRYIASLCSIFSLIGIFTAQIMGSHLLLVSLEVYNPYFFILLWSLIILYALMGGLKAIVQNDIFQLTFIILVFFGLFIFDIFSNPLANLESVISKSYSLTIAAYSTKWTELFVVPLIPALYCLIEQDLTQIFFAARTPSLGKTAAGIAALFLILFAFIPLYFGIKANVTGIPLNTLSNPLILFFDKYYNPFIVTLVVYGVFAAIVSTANGVLCAISSNIVHDFKLTSISKKYQVLISRFVMSGVGLIGMLLAFCFDDILKVLIDSYAIPVTALFVSLSVVYITQRKDLNTLAASVSVITGLITFSVFLISKIYLIFGSEIDALILSALAYTIVSCKNLKLLKAKLT